MNHTDLDEDWNTHRGMRLPCGGTAYFDVGSGISYRCEDCGAVVGSIGQPRECRDEADKWYAYEKSGMWRWNYQTGKSEPCN